MVKRENLRKWGIYLVVALLMINFLIKPLRSSLSQQRRMFSELKETYLLKEELYEKKLLLAQKSQLQSEPKSLSLLYPSDIPYNSLRIKVLRWLIEKAEEKGLTITNFELPELRRGKEVTEISLLLRLKGKIKPFLEYLQAIESADKLILVKNLELYPSREEFNISVTFSFFRRER